MENEQLADSVKLQRDDMREAFEARKAKMYGKKPRIYHDGKYYGGFQSLWEEFEAGGQASAEHIRAKLQSPEMAERVAEAIAKICSDDRVMSVHKLATKAAIAAVLEGI